ncbi:hypothetical protein [Streptosporangium sp. NPDC006007]|uniref:hypothetical protein n=1 Tax=Streptosporangium sp. NPDC006007 TaxID=3154575 RepID=UPI0033B832DC
MSQGKPEFGYGEGRRPLWTACDRDAEAVRKALRKAGRREFGQGHGGFVVEGGGEGVPFLLACANDAEISVQELVQYEAVLIKAGYRIEPDPGDDQALQVWLPS